MDEDASSPDVEALLTAFRYWLPAIADCARIVENGDGAGRCFAVDPQVSGGCAIAVRIFDDGTCAVRMNGQKGDALLLSSPRELIALAEAVAEGFVVRRDWSSIATGTAAGVEFIVGKGTSQEWRGGARPSRVDGHESRDHAYLPYRRAHD